MIDLCSIISINRGRSIKKGRKQVFLDVVHFGRIPLQAEQYILYMGKTQFKEFAFHNISRIPVAGNHDCFILHQHRLQNQSSNPLDQFSVIRMSGEQIIIA